jgi:hypothetical protein
MSYQELMSKHKARSDVSDLDSDEKEVYEAFLALGETKADEQILSRAWLKEHHRRVLERM